MKRRSILFSAPMVRALRARRKTQTRRVITPQPDHVQVHEWKGKVLYDAEHRMWWWRDKCWDLDVEMQAELPQLCPYGAPGDRLVVKEASWIWCERRPNGKTKTGRAKYLYVPVGRQVVYCADGAKPTEPIDHEPDRLWRWKAGRFMPSWASRLTLVVESVRVERLHLIDDAGALAEGVEPGDDMEPIDCPRASFAALWRRINGAESWSANPWVWVVGFSVEEQAQQAEAA